MKTKITQEDIFEKYPVLYREKDLPMDKSCMYWGLDVPDEWLPVIDKLSYVLSDPPSTCYRADPDNYKSYVQAQPDIIALQVKIKFGLLRFYYKVELTDENKPEKMPDEKVAECVGETQAYADGAIALAELLCDGEPY